LQLSLLVAWLLAWLRPWKVEVVLKRPLFKAKEKAKEEKSRGQTFSLAPRLTPIVVILPVYNEQACIQATCHQVQRFLYAHPHFTFIFVDDGSTDLTKSILGNCIRSAKHPQMQMLSYQPRAGKGYAIKTAVQAITQCEFICFIDGDLAYSLDHLEPMLVALQTTDIVIGSRSLGDQTSQGLSRGRKLAGKVFNWLSRRLLNLPHPDMQAGLKGFRQAAAQEIFERQQLQGFCFDVELIYVAKKLGYTISAIPAQISAHHQRKISKVNLVQDSLKMFRDLLQIRFNDGMGRYR
jgi:dolichyl-phosphate beta-glucosyltransferase